MTEFVASNGNKIRYDTTGLFVEGSSINGGNRLFPSQVAALREFFRAERDSELGRWRSQKLPYFVVYPSQENEDHERAFGAGLDCVILRETDGAMKGYVSAEDEWPEGRGGGNEWRLVGREYAAAHPEPKPWEKAETGEVWVLTGRGGLEQVWLRTRTDRWRNAAIELLVYYPAPEGIIAGRRIWPEASHD